MCGQHIGRLGNSELVSPVRAFGPGRSNFGNNSVSASVGNMAATHLPRPRDTAQRCQSIRPCVRGLRSATSALHDPHGRSCAPTRALPPLPLRCGGTNHVTARQNRGRVTVRSSRLRAVRVGVTMAPKPWALRVPVGRGGGVHLSSATCEQNDHSPQHGSRLEGREAGKKVTTMKPFIKEARWRAREARRGRRARTEQEKVTNYTQQNHSKNVDLATYDAKKICQGLKRKIIMFGIGLSAGVWSCWVRARGCGQKSQNARGFRMALSPSISRSCTVGGRSATCCGFLTA